VHGWGKHITEKFKGLRAKGEMMVNWEEQPERIKNKNETSGSKSFCNEGLDLLVAIKENGNSCDDGGGGIICFYCGGDKFSGMENHYDDCLYGKIEKLLSKKQA
jgi:hypothetical protein